MPVSALADELGIHRTVLYHWQCQQEAGHDGTPSSAVRADTIVNVYAILYGRPHAACYVDGWGTVSAKLAAADELRLAEYGLRTASTPASEFCDSYGTPQFSPAKLFRPFQIVGKSKSLNPSEPDLKGVVGIDYPGETKINQ